MYNLTLNMFGPLNPLKGTYVMCFIYNILTKYDYSEPHLLNKLVFKNQYKNFGLQIINR
jgi:hypothetical protein